MRTTTDITRHIHRPPYPQELPKPLLVGGRVDDPYKIGLCVPSMKHHTTDEGFQLFQGLEYAGYTILGYGLHKGHPEYGDRTDVDGIINFFSAGFPATVVLQDKREWIGKTAGKGFDPRETFTNVSSLREHPEVFRVGVLKNAHSDQVLHTESAIEAGLHAWIVYYHPAIVAAQASYVRPQHLIRTYHSINVSLIPPFGTRLQTVGLLSGAVSGAYPLRSRLALACENGQMKYLTYRKHPGYGRDKCYTPEYLELLSTCRVAVCTSSRWGYALRKIIEATAAGCIVVTDLPSDDVLPEIDGNLVRVREDISPGELDGLVGDLCRVWDADVQLRWADRAQAWYDYGAVGRRLANDIEKLRAQY